MTAPEHSGAPEADGGSKIESSPNKYARLEAEVEANVNQVTDPEQAHHMAHAGESLMNAALGQEATANQVREAIAQLPGAPDDPHSAQILYSAESSAQRSAAYMREDADRIMDSAGDVHVLNKEIAAAEAKRNRPDDPVITQKIGVLEAQIQATQAQLAQEEATITELDGRLYNPAKLLKRRNANSAARSHRQTLLTQQTELLDLRTEQARSKLS